ncbi:MAG: recombinase family protein, partial [Pseudonocardiaceae bacterium]
GGVRPYGWGVNTGRVRSVCVNPGAAAMERVYEQVPVLDMTRHNEAEATEIRHWASELLSGVSIAHLLRDLAQRGVRTVAMTDGREVRRNGRRVEHRGWNSKTIMQILTTPRTSGHVVYRGEIVTRNAYQEILPDDTRQALITLFSDPIRKTSPGNTPKWLGSLIYECGACRDGAVMSVRKNSQGQFVYRCRVKGHCSWLAERVDTYVENVLVGLLARLDAADLVGGQRVDVDVVALRDELIVLDKRKQEAAQCFTLGRIDRVQMETISATAAQRISEIRAQLASVSEENPLSEFTMTDNAARTWESLSLGRRREILRRMLTVTLPPLGRGHRFHRDLIQIEKRKPAPSPTEAA